MLVVYISGILRFFLCTYSAFVGMDWPFSAYFRTWAVPVSVYMAHVLLLYVLNMLGSISLRRSILYSYFCFRPENTTSTEQPQAQTRGYWTTEYAAYSNTTPIRGYARKCEVTRKPMANRYLIKRAISQQQNNERMGKMDSEKKNPRKTIRRDT